MISYFFQIGFHEKCYEIPCSNLRLPPYQNVLIRICTRIILHVIMKINYKKISLHLIFLQKKSADQASDNTLKIELFSKHFQKNVRFLIKRDNQLLSYICHQNVFNSLFLPAPSSTLEDFFGGSMASFSFCNLFFAILEGNREI